MKDPLAGLMMEYVRQALIAANPKIEICAFKDETWLRIACELVEDDRIKAHKSMLDAYPELRSMYNENDGNTQVFYMK